MVVGWLLIALPAILAILGLYFLQSVPLIGLIMLFFSGLSGSLMLLMLRFLSPSLFAVFKAKLKRKDLLLVLTEGRRYIPYVGTFESGWVWLKDRLGFIVGTPDDVGFLDGVPTYVCYRGVGKTLNPKAIVDLAVLEKELGEEIALEIRNKLFEKGLLDTLEYLESERGGGEVVKAETE